MGLRDRVAKLEAAASDLERDREVLTHFVSKLEKRLQKLENPSAAAWSTYRGAITTNVPQPIIITRFLDGSATPAQDLSEWLAI